MASQSARPMARAPPDTAASRISAGSPAAASDWRSLAMMLMRYISRNMSRALLEAGPSVPTARFTPFSTASFRGKMPLASLPLEQALITAVQPWRAKMSISSGVKYTQW